MSASTIRRVATDVFARQGYHGASLRQIAKASKALTPACFVPAT